MKKVTELPNRRLIEQEAVEWLIKLDADELPTEEELLALKEWMAISPIHTEELEKLGAFWSDLSLTELNIPLVKQSMASLADEQKSSNGRDRRKFNVLGAKGWAVAACIVAVAIVMIQQTLLPYLGDDIGNTNGHYVTAIGKQSTIPLADGSEVRLNTNSQIKVEYTESYRNIHLIQGEAHFEVAEDETKPFRVYAGGGRVEAVGTAFTVYLRQKDVDVLVTEGKVALAAQVPVSEGIKNTEITADLEVVEAADGGGSAYYLTLPAESVGLLKKGQGATILYAQDHNSDDKNTIPVVKPMNSIDVKRREAWRKGLLIFTGDSLEEVVQEVSRYTAMSIEIVDPELKRIRIGGQFRVGDLNSMFDVLEENFDLKIIRSDDNRVLIAASQ